MRAATLRYALQQAEARAHDFQLRAEIAEGEVRRLTSALDRCQREVDQLKARLAAVTGGAPPLCSCEFGAERLDGVTHHRIVCAAGGEDPSGNLGRSVS